MQGVLNTIEAPSDENQVCQRSADAAISISTGTAIWRLASHVALRRYILRLLAAAMVLLPAAPRSDAAEVYPERIRYVVLTDLAEDDPYFAAAKRLQENRSAQIIRFPSGHLTEALGPLRRAHPASVAVVVRPETLDINFAYEVLKLAVRVDDDPFVDFAYGFITGATAADALGLVERTIQAEAGPPLSNGRLVAFGPTSTPQADQGNAFEWLPAWRRMRIEHEPGRFPQTNLRVLAEADVIRFWGHGAPDGVDGGLSRADLDGLDVRARAVFAGPCFSAVTRRYYESAACSASLEARCVDADRSLALTFLSKGTLAYFGALQEDRCISAGQEMEHALTSGEPLGMTLKHTHDRIAMAHTSGAMRFARFRDGVCPPAEKGMEAQLRLAAARVLLGDPAFRPFAGPAAHGVEVSAHKTSSGLEVVAAIVDPRVRSLFVNPFHDDLCECDTDNDTLYVRVRLPEAAGAICGVRRVELPPGLERIAHGEVTWKEEQWQGERFLHLQLDFRHDALGEVVTNTAMRFVMEVAK